MRRGIYTRSGIRTKTADFVSPNFEVSLAIGSDHNRLFKIEWGKIDSMVSKPILYSCSRCQTLLDEVYDIQLTGKA